MRPIVLLIIAIVILNFASGVAGFEIFQMGAATCSPEAQSHPIVVLGICIVVLNIASGMAGYSIFQMGKAASSSQARQPATRK